MKKKKLLILILIIINIVAITMCFKSVLGSIIKLLQDEEHDEKKEIENVQLINKNNFVS